MALLIVPQWFKNENGEPLVTFHCNNDKMILLNSDWQLKISSKTRWSTGISPQKTCFLKNVVRDLDF